ncbi:MAG: transposase [Bacteroidales bacterium]|nr:transposase [Bacteroidales bacterium]
MSDLIQHIKGCSSKWINENRLANGWFSWQEGYGAFSYISTRSFRAPYHTISDVALVGDGTGNPDAAFS